MVAEAALRHGGGMRIPRLRTLLLGLAGVTALVVAGVIGVGLIAWSTAATDTRGDVSFDRPLPIPPLAPSRVGRDGERTFSLEARAGEHEFEPGTRTATAGFNGAHLGPTLRARRGERVAVEVRNRLDEDTTVHWHGMHLPGRMDGGPHQPVRPGGTWRPEWRIDQPAASLWYHPHPHGETSEQVRRGLAGMFIVDDPASDRAGLPRDYGVDDVPLLLQDVELGGDGRLEDGGWLVAPTGPLGDRVAVNGAVGAHLRVTTQRVRLRLLNASRARIYDIGLAGGRPLEVVASDGGLLPAPVRTERVLLSPGERAEVVVTMKPGERAVLASHPTDLSGDPFTERFSGGDDGFDLLELRAAARLRPSPALPRALVPAEQPAAASRTRTFRLGGVDINDRSMAMHRIDATARLGATETWTVVNDVGTPHNFHVHGVSFRVVDVDGSRPKGHLAGWKDTVFVPPGAEVELRVRFTRSAPAHAPFMFHCHLLRHEDAGMMGQLVVRD